MLARCVLRKVAATVGLRHALVTRTFGAATREQEPAFSETNDMIRDYIKGIMDKQNSDELLKPITDDELDKRVQDFQVLFDEAHSCVADCEEATPANMEEESKAASEAVDHVFAAYIDLLEDLRCPGESRESQYQDIREKNATKLKLLRRELGAILQRS